MEPSIQGSATKRIHSMRAFCNGRPPVNERLEAAATRQWRVWFEEGQWSCECFRLPSNRLQAGFHQFSPELLLGSITSILPSDAMGERLARTIA